MQELWQLEMEYLDRRRDGMDISEIRKELQQKDVSNENIALIIGAIDDAIYKELVPEKKEPSYEWDRVFGLLLIIGGIGISVGTYFGLIDAGGYYVITYGPILSGLGLLASNRRRTKGKFRRW